MALPLPGPLSADADRTRTGGVEHVAAGNAESARAGRGDRAALFSPVIPRNRRAVVAWNGDLVVSSSVNVAMTPLNAEPAVA